MDARAITDRIATLVVTRRPRTGAIVTANPALLFASGTLAPASVPFGAYSAAENAAALFDEFDACELWHHLAVPAPEFTVITGLNDDALVASAHPSIIHHVMGTDSRWRDGRDPRSYNSLPVRAVLDSILDRCENQWGLLDEPSKSAHEILVRDTTGKAPDDAIDRTIGARIGPFTGWQIVPGDRVRVEPFGLNNFRPSEQVLRIQSVIDSVGGSASDWCDAYDALRSSADFVGGNSNVTAMLSSQDLISERRFVSQLFLDLVMWAVGRTIEPRGHSRQIDGMGRPSPITDRTRRSSRVRISPDGGRKTYVGIDDAILVFESYGPSDVPLISAPLQRITVPLETVHALCTRLGAPENAHPVPVISLFADEILMLGPRLWLQSYGVEEFRESHPDAIDASSSHRLGERFSLTTFRPSSGGHAAGKQRPGKSEFPASWTSRTAAARIWETVREPSSRTTIGSTEFLERQFDGVSICALRKPTGLGLTRVVVVYPIAGQGVTFNPYPDDYPLNLVDATSDALISCLADVSDNRIRLAVAASKCGEPYEAIESSLHLVLDNSVALPLSLMNDIAQLIYGKYFEDDDFEEIPRVFQLIAERDYPSECWGPVRA
ncbi:hypothetical protein ACIGKR_12915 [Rhodococcus qingshengii]|uniref:hypothetical protein n=1 Tax=Rhodococcus qingshengii TaxID=334542 RepID=UPI0037C796DD